MQQFDIVENANLDSHQHVPYLLVMQAQLFDKFEYSVVAPLIPLKLFGEPLAHLTPVISIADADVCQWPRLPECPLRHWDRRSIHLSDSRLEIISALDFLSPEVSQIVTAQLLRYSEYPIIGGKNRPILAALVPGVLLKTYHWRTAGFGEWRGPAPLLNTSRSNGRFQLLDSTGRRNFRRKEFVEDGGSRKGQGHFSSNTTYLKLHRTGVVCRLVNEKITFVHRRLLSAVVRLANELDRDQTNAISRTHE